MTAASLRRNFLLRVALSRVAPGRGNSAGATVVFRFRSVRPGFLNMIKATPAALALSFAVLFADAASAACVNRFVARTERGRPHQTLTLLTGKMTFQEAQALAKAIQDKSAQPVEIVDAKGKSLARQFGELKVVRPMPVGCDGKTSGVVMVVTFPLVAPPTGKVLVKLDANTTVEFEEQKD